MSRVVSFVSIIVIACLYPIYLAMIMDDSLSLLTSKYYIDSVQPSFSPLRLQRLVGGKPTFAAHLLCPTPIGYKSGSHCEFGKVWPLGPGVESLITWSGARESTWPCSDKRTGPGFRHPVLTSPIRWAVVDAWGWGCKEGLVSRTVYPACNCITLAKRCLRLVLGTFEFQSLFGMGRVRGLVCVQEMTGCASQLAPPRQSMICTLCHRAVSVISHHCHGGGRSVTDVVDTDAKISAHVSLVCL